MVATARPTAVPPPRRAPVHRRRIDPQTRLDLVVEIGNAVASGQDLASIVEHAGQRIADIFRVRTVAIALYDQRSGMITWPFEMAEGETPPGRTEPFALGPGLTSEVIRSRAPLVMATNAESTAHGALSVGELLTESWLGVPMLAGDRVGGVIVLESLRKHAFDEGDVKLLSTLGGTIGVAIENARLVEETKRLLGESEARAAELGLINEIGTALAQQLDFDTMVESVGERLRVIFQAQAEDIFVALHDPATDTVTFPYEIDGGRRIHTPAIPLGQGLTSIVIRSAVPCDSAGRRIRTPWGGS